MTKLRLLKLSWVIRTLIRRHQLWIESCMLVVLVLILMRRMLLVLRMQVRGAWWMMLDGSKSLCGR